ncbi:uncharacterized protein LOC21396334 isoform X2 [Morus notabilis]|uniref:uncharacterized protein LOC21396334 isoform X2 n=1 Tax=Morus notabilis TaxID=981085 RepID=UPI000CED59A1|nr:uncharacterized protein LOC21396334 isoform X2 [Morus notabilis]
MVERFFSTRQMEDRSHSHSHPIMLLSGPPSSGKTSLLFQYAYNSATQTSFSHQNVLFICNRRNLESNPPFLSQHIQMKYVEDDEGIKRYFAAFHLHNTLPSTIIIDDFGDFFDERSCQERYGNSRGRELAMVRTLALCHNAIIHANETRPCKLLLSDTHRGDSLRLLFIYKRWVSTIFTIKGDGSGSFILKSNSSSESKRTAKYTIALHYLCLEGITEDCEQ